MKSLFLLCFFIFSCLVTVAQTNSRPDTAKKTIEVEAACGQCKFGLEGKSCDLAVRINGKAMFVDGTGIDDHGDAHGDNGFCNSIRKAKVKGEVINGRFKLSYFKLLPVDENKR